MDSSALLALALFLAMLSTVVHAFMDEAGFPEWGVAGVTFGIPVLIGFCGVRREFLRAIGAVCVVFATADLSFDALDYFGVAHLASHVGEARVRVRSALSGRGREQLRRRSGRVPGDIVCGERLRVG